MKKTLGIGNLVWLGSTMGIFLVGCVLRIPEPNLFVEGVVRDAVTGKPIEGAKVSDEGYGVEPFFGTITDTQGRYRYLTWYEEHSIVASASGYETQRRLLKTKFFGNEREIVMPFDLFPENDTATH